MGASMSLSPHLPWIAGLALLALGLAGVAFWALRPRTPRQQPLPTEWAVSPRPVFSSDERRVYRQLREALPHHTVLAKVPLVRFCQPNDPAEVRYWYELLGTIHVTFAVCSANGRVLAAIDLENDRANSRRVVDIKQNVLGACRVRYLRCPVDRLPSIPELQLLVPHNPAGARGPQAAVGLGGRDAMGTGAAYRRRPRSTLWQDSGFFQDSFFGIDSLRDANPSSGFSGFGVDLSRTRAAGLDDSPEDGGGIVVESVAARAPTRH